MEITNVYFDMDGVLADFGRGVEELCNLKRVDQSLGNKDEEDRMWASIRAVENFYYKLKPMEGAVDMFKQLYERYGNKCEILTAIPKAKRGIVGADVDKKKWVHDYLSPDIKVNIVFKEQKKDFCKGESSILIDDYDANINAWREYGGTGIQFTDAESAIKKLKDIGAL